MTPAARRVALGLLLAVPFGVTCGGDGTGPVGGTLAVRLATPTADPDGAILFTVSGPAGVTGASAPPGLRVFTDSLGSTTVTFAVTGALSAGRILTLEVGDVNQASRYAATVLQVAAPDYRLRPLAGYSLTVAP